MSLSSRQNQDINQVVELYQKLDQEIEDFKKATNLGCVNGCGRCCENPEVYVTVLEVMPLALSLYKENKAQEVLDSIKSEKKGWCVFYTPDPLIKGNGRCSVYLGRPLICRLFGFATKKDKHGQPQLVTCQIMKKECAPQYAQTEKSLKEKKLTAPSMQKYAMNIFNIDPFLGRDQLPINQAIAIAIEKIAILMRDEKKE